MRSKQKGMTGIGMMCIAALVGVIALAFFKVVPFYLEMTKVYTILDDIERDFSNNSSTNAKILRAQIENRIDIESVYGVSPKEFIIKRTHNGYSISLQKDQEARYAYNLYLIVKYDKSVEIIK